MKYTAAERFTPATLMVWTLTDEVIENRSILEGQFREIHASGFGGVAVYVRCSRYTWYDPPARDAFRAVGRLCRRHGLACWLGPDPRFVSRPLIQSDAGMEVLLFGDRSRADRFPNFGEVRDGRFCVRCHLEPRHVHTLNEVAIEYYPHGIARAYALRLDAATGVPHSVTDITTRCQFFYNARAHYVEAFGRIPGVDGDDWKILVFFKAGTSHVDYSNPQQLRKYHAMLATLKSEGCVADAIMWDEAGYTCTYGTLPSTPAILKAYRKRAGKDLFADLWHLALPSSHGTHTRTRCIYYEEVQRSLNTANMSTANHIRRLWGGGTVSGIHDTWHFESADMCDMNHGSLDLWQAAKSKSGGFVDLGGIDQLRDPAAPWYAHLAAMNVICASLGKLSKGEFAYNNLWTVGDDNGEGWQTTVMDHCVNTMAIFGLRWMAHAYGPVGTIGEERSFLGSPELPGYPNHSTWPNFPHWNSRLVAHLESANHALPKSNVLVVFPVESLYALAGPPADAVSAEIFRLVLALLDNHYQVDVHASSLLHEGRWERGEYVLGSTRYSAIIFPFPTVLAPASLAVMRKRPERVCCYGDTLRQIVSGRRCAISALTARTSIASTIEWLARIPGVRLLEAPQNSWATLTPMQDAMLVSLCPSRHGAAFSGTLRVGAMSVQVPESRALVRAFFPPTGEPRIDVQLPDSR
jgi:hypothetical protein